MFWILFQAERQELPSSLFILSGTNPLRRAAIWIVRWIVFEWIIILTIIGNTKTFLVSNHYSNLLKLCTKSRHSKEKCFKRMRLENWIARTDLIPWNKKDRILHLFNASSKILVNVWEKVSNLKCKLLSHPAYIERF